jgi:hypothetical protein
MRIKTFAVKAIMLALFLAFASQGYAYAESFNVTVNTSSLGPGEFDIFFLLNGTGPNTATLSDIALGGGVAGDIVGADGSGAIASNNLNTGISLADSTDFFNDFGQSFQPGGEISFLLNLTTNVVPVQPDQFALVILDTDGNFLPSADPDTGNLLAINIDSGTPTPDIYSDLVTVTAATPAPEPSSLWLLSSGLSALALLCLTQKNGSGRS